jgi:hypothetical protein
MKKIFVSLMLIAACFAALPSMAQNRFSISAGTIRSLHLGENMKVVLLANANGKTDVVADDAAQRKVRFSISSRTLYVHATDEWKEADVLTIHVSGIEVLTVGENTTVESDLIMTAPEMEVHVSAGSIARIKTFGKVQGYSTDGSEVELKKWPLHKQTVNSF